MKNTFLPALTWLARYERKWLRTDLLAGLTTAAVVIPKAMAYATVAGLPVQVGIYTALVPVAVYALFGTSRPLSVSSTATLGILCATALSNAVPDDDPGRMLAASSTLAVLVGAILILARILKLGFVANFISDPVLTGFKAGIGLVVVVDQLPKLLGIHIHKVGWMRDVGELIQHLPDSSVPTLTVGLATLAIIVLLEHFAPRWPSPLIVVGGGIGAAFFLELPTIGVATVGHVPGGLPNLIKPELSLFESLWAPAVAIALMSFTETIAAGRAFTAPGESRPDANQELVATGLANMAGGIFGAMPGGGGTSQTAVNRKAGALTQMAAFASAGVALATLLFLAPVVGLIPQATLAAVVIAFSVGLINLEDFREIRRFRSQEFQWALVACVGVVLLGTLKGIVAAVILSMISLLRMANNPPVYVMGRKRDSDVFRPLSPDNPDDETFPGLLILKTENRIYFGNAQNVGDRMWPLVKEARPQVLLLDCSGIPGIEFTAFKMLCDAEAKLREEGTELWLAALSPESWQLIQGSPLHEVLGNERLFFTVPQAVEHYLAQAAVRRDGAP
ncbi:SulP family inorganic anion transporter [Methylococcus sp. EFPC2]|uniref:SulP family inorganic anion transporter n=1 Tax=Methylococcus sp. EFPC2 TaxID=2812648 RepID=UPI0019687A35|nr:SulP family inorganic anion transporter [Methylococcus sp. EFPC2]QSA97832.1 SulP family inorganic anion transporter [Methylococcus sp. EFPC2]